MTLMISDNVRVSLLLAINLCQFPPTMHSNRSSSAVPALQLQDFCTPQGDCDRHNVSHTSRKRVVCTPLHQAIACQVSGLLQASKQGTHYCLARQLTLPLPNTQLKVLHMHVNPSFHLCYISRIFHPSIL